MCSAHGWTGADVSWLERADFNKQPKPQPGGRIALVTVHVSVNTACVRDRRRECIIYISIYICDKYIYICIDNYVQSRKCTVTQHTLVFFKLRGPSGQYSERSWKIFRGISTCQIARRISAGTICSQSLNSVGHGSKNQLFDALQWGKWKAGQRVLSVDSA